MSSGVTLRELLSKIGELYGFDAVGECVAARAESAAKDPATVDFENLDASCRRDCQRVLQTINLSFPWTFAPGGVHRWHPIARDLAGYSVSKVMALDVDEWRLGKV